MGGNGLMAAQKKVDGLSPIMADAIYPLPDFMKRTGLAKAAIRMMRRSGLIVRRIGRRSFIWGRDFHDWFNTNAEPVCGHVSIQS
jgi:hypothetical protein